MAFVKEQSNLGEDPHKGGEHSGGSNSKPLPQQGPCCPVLASHPCPPGRGSVSGVSLAAGPQAQPPVCEEVRPGLSLSSEAV